MGRPLPARPGTARARRRAQLASVRMATEGVTAWRRTSRVAQAERVDPRVQDRHVDADALSSMAWRVAPGWGSVPPHPSRRARPDRMRGAVTRSHA